MWREENTLSPIWYPFEIYNVTRWLRCHKILQLWETGILSRAFQVVREFEAAVGDYTGAPFVVAVNSCTNALFLSLMFYKQLHPHIKNIRIPKRTYVSVPMQIRIAGLKVEFEDREWSGAYQLSPFPVWDSARRFTSNMYFQTGGMVCTSHHWNKILGIQQGGCILHNNYDADAWLRRARFDGRTEGVSPKEDRFTQLGWHMYMSPEIAAEGLVRLSHLPKHNPDMPMDDYPDLSENFLV